MSSENMRTASWTSSSIVSKPGRHLLSSLPLTFDMRAIQNFKRKNWSEGDFTRPAHALRRCPTLSFAGRPLGRSDSLPTRRTVGISLA